MSAIELQSTKKANVAKVKDSASYQRDLYAANMFINISSISSKSNLKLATLFPQKTSSSITTSNPTFNPTYYDKMVPDSSFTTYPPGMKKKFSNSPSKYQSKNLSYNYSEEPSIEKSSAFSSSSPISNPTVNPTEVFNFPEPSRLLSRSPSNNPTESFSEFPTIRVSEEPSRLSSSRPSNNPTEKVSDFPTINFSEEPSELSIISPSPVNNVYFRTITPIIVPTNSPTLNSTIMYMCGMSPSERRVEITNIVQSISYVDIKNSPQHRALEWILNEDGTNPCPQEELSLLQRYIVAVFYFSTSGDNWDNCSRYSNVCVDSGGRNRSNFLTDTHECSWGGLGCDDSDLCLNSIKLDNSNLSGSLPFEIGYLSCLKLLDLDDNNINGRIPDMFTSLSNLHTIDLDNNYLEGTLPESIYSLPNLVIFDVNDNLLTGTISSQIDGLEKLEFLQFDNNFLQGTFPSTIGNLENLHIFTAIGLNITGTVPIEICNLHYSGGLIHIWADCAGLTPKVECSCCTKCR